jgi:hypothetical protein
MAMEAEADVRAAFNTEFPRGESLTLGTLEESISGLEVFLKTIGVLVAAEIRPMAAPPPDPGAAMRNFLVVTAPLRTAAANYETAQRIIHNLDEIGCHLPTETVTRLGTAIEQARALAERL